MADEDDEYRESPDDALEETRRDDDGMFHPLTDEEKLEEDNDSPASPATDIPAPREPASHQLNDTDIEQSDLYDGGRDQANDISEREIGPDHHVAPVDLDHEE